MIKYRLKGSNEIFDAYQFLDDDHNETRVYPRWFMDLLVSGRVEMNPASGWWLDRKKKIDNRSWIVVNPKDELGFTVLTDDLFGSTFAEVDGAGS
jgi:hypothetical protein